MDNKKVYNISQINNYIKQILDKDSQLNNIWVRGEISNFKHHFSGHMYMTLKDEASVIKAVMFKMSADRLKFVPQSGMKIIASGRVAVYERDGQYQLYIDEMQPDGIGALHIAFEQLKEKLKSEGLFDDKYKVSIPQFPKTIGVITASTGAAIRDVIHVLKRRYPLGKVIIYPVLVQGDDSPPQISSAIEYFNKEGLADLLIVGRGGGSIEDLWAFNSELVARAVFNSKIPIISAVGHETDFTICDFVADMRAPTPSAAAEIAAPSLIDIAEKLFNTEQRLIYSFSKGIEQKKNKLKNYISHRSFTRPYDKINENRQYIDNLQHSLYKSATILIGKKREMFFGFAASLEALSPLKVLERGYAVMYNEGNLVVKSASKIMPGDLLKAHFFDGTVNCKVIDKEK